jgi:hypothetical protein
MSGTPYSSAKATAAGKSIKIGRDDHVKAAGSSRRLQFVPENAEKAAGLLFADLTSHCQHLSCIP